MNLVYVESVQFVRAVLDSPILDIALMDHHIRWGMGVIDLRLLSLNRDEEKRRAVRIRRIGRFLGEVELAAACRRDVSEPGGLGSSK